MKSFRFNYYLIVWIAVIIAVTCFKVWGQDVYNPSYSQVGVPAGSINITNIGALPWSPSDFSPFNFTNKYPLALWLDANQVTTKVDGTQQEWIDSSGNGRNATNATSGSRPIWHPNLLNNHPGFTFNGTDQMLTTSGFLNSTYNSNITVFIVSGHKRGAGNGGQVSLGDFAMTGTGTNTISFTSRLNFYLVGANGGGQLLFLEAGMFDMTAPYIQSFVYSSTNTVFAINGCEAFNDGNGVANAMVYPYNKNNASIATSFGNASIAQPVGVGLSFLNTGGNQTFWDGEIYEVLVYNGAFSDLEHALMVQYLNRKWGLGGSQIIFAGDSICFGFTITDGGNYPSKTMTLLGGLPFSATGQSKWSAVNIGWSGATVSSNSTASMPGLANTFPFQFQNQIKIGDIAVLEGLTNDGDRGVSTNMAYTNYVNWCQKTKQAGAKVVALTVLPRTTLNSVTTNAFELWRVGMNNMISNNWSLFADGLANVGADPTIGTHASSSNLLYYSDGCHPTSLGNAYIATNIAVAIQSLSGITPNIGINPIITVGASPFSYTNISGAKQLTFVNGGTVSAVAINGTTVVAGSNTSVPLQNGDYVTVTYSVAPTMSRRFY